MEKIKVAFFISNLGPGGAERQLIELLRNIDKSKFEVSLYLYAYQKEAFFKDIFEATNIHVYTNVLKRKIIPLKIAEAILFIRNNIIRNEFDLLFSTLFMNNVLLRLAAPLKYKKKIIANCRTSLKTYSLFYMFFEKMQLPNSFLVFNSLASANSFKNKVSSKYFNQIICIPNGFSIDRRELPMKINRAHIVIGGLGRQGLEKNFLQLVRVFIQVNNEQKNTKLILQGNRGDQTEEIIKYISLYKMNDFITLAPENRDIKLFFEKIDIMVLPSHFEGCPNVLFESLIFKRICIVSEGANSDQYIVNGENGFVYDGTDNGLKIALLNAIDTLGSEKEKEITEKGFAYVRNNFSTELMVERYEKLFVKIHEAN